MPRTTRNDQPETPRRAGQGAAATPGAVADREPAGRAARNRTNEGSRAEEPAQPPTTASQAESADRQATAPSNDDIARRAYELYQQRGSNADGQDVDDWLRAEAELREGRGRRDDET